MIGTGLALPVMLSMAALQSSPAATAEEVREAMAVEAFHRGLLTVDVHAHITFRPENFGTHELDPGGLTFLQIDLPKMRMGGLDVVIYNLFTDQRPLTPEGYTSAYSEAVIQYDAIMRLVRAYPGEISLARSAEEIESIIKEGRLVTVLSIENPFPLGESLEALEMWYERGVRVISLVHDGHNQFADSRAPRSDIGDEPDQHGGLTSLGRDLIAEANRLGIVLDVSHASTQTLLQTATLSRTPIIASHSGVQGAWDHPRNLTDEEVRAIAATGGLVALIPLRGYVGEYSAEYRQALSDLISEFQLDTAEGRNAATQDHLQDFYARRDELLEIHNDITIAAYADQIDYVVDLVGVDHAGVGTDFNGGGGVGNWDDASESQALTEELLQRGYSHDDIARIWGGNFLRVMRAVEAAAE